MTNPIDHHYVPQFLLRQWRRSDGRLVVFSRKNQKVVADWKTPKTTAYEPDLYAIDSVPPEDRQLVETKVMSQAVDSPASVVFKRLLNGELNQFNSEDRSAWVRFILAQWVRTPEEIEKLKKRSDDSFRSALAASPEQCDAIKGDAPEKSLEEWVKNHAPGLSERIAMGRLLPKLIGEGVAGHDVIKMRWEVLRVPVVCGEFLTSDQPAVRLDGLGSRDCMIVIPLCPCQVFIASHYDRGLAKSKPKQLIKAVNKTMVQAARNKVFAASERDRKLIAKWLGHDQTG